MIYNIQNIQVTFLCLLCIENILVSSVNNIGFDSLFIINGKSLIYIVTCSCSATNNLWVLDHLHRFIGSYLTLVIMLSYHYCKIVIAHSQL
jgi:hypothetical protein